MIEHLQGTQSEEEGEEEKNALKYDINYLRWYQHVGRAILQRGIPAIISALTTFGVIWGLIEGWVFTKNSTIDSPLLFPGMVAISLIVGFGTMFGMYIRIVPEGLDEEDEYLARIAHIKKKLWEYDFALELLEDRLNPIDHELENLLAGHTYIPIDRNPGIDEYNEWLDLRPDNLIRMVEVASQLLIHDFPDSLKATNDLFADPNEIISSVEKVEELYSQTLDYEIEGRSIKPPEGYEKIHVLQLGWAQTIRDPILKLFDYLKIIKGLNPRDNPQIEFTIEFIAPLNLDEFNEESKRLGR